MQKIIFEENDDFRTKRIFPYRVRYEPNLPMGSLGPSEGCTTGSLSAPNLESLLVRSVTYLKNCKTPILPISVSLNPSIDDQEKLFVKTIFELYGKSEGVEVSVSQLQ